MPAPTTTLHSLSTRLATSLAAGGHGLEDLAEAEPLDWRDHLLSMLAIHDLHLAPIDVLGGSVLFQHHPDVATLKLHLDAGFEDILRGRDADAAWDLPQSPTAAMRMIGRSGLVPEVYDWLAEEATLPEIVEYLALEGGPDGGFDDLVAACQIGLDGPAKLELACNYWDEMGNGRLDRVHTTLHRQLVEALGIPQWPRDEQPVEALERIVLTTLLATNRRLQPQLLGALGLLELQAGPRCRKVVRALNRVGAGWEALDFYVEHATVDPRHGKDWVDNAVAPFENDPLWAEGIVEGARWRSIVNAGFFAAMRVFFERRTQRAS